ncbi:MAG TPA: Fic family protein [Xanthomonadaceae bacterium]|nr:Fic family protein [Xanthomonadaceae bacterium]
MSVPVLRIETDRFGPFTFQAGVDLEALGAPLIRVADAWRMFSASPLAQVANQLQREVLVQSVFGTNTIEGANLTEEETGRALDLDPERVQAEQDIRVRNIKTAYDLAVRASEDPAWRFSIDYVRAIHAEICRDLPDPDNLPGLFRENDKARPTVVGDAAHGGVYKPPQSGRDIARLMDGLVEWHTALIESGISPLVRAPLVHLYYEWIHPFRDGNGRVGRVLEATLLRHAGYKYAPFALAKFYQEQIHRYFTLFNTCRKAASRDEPNPHQPFIEFHLEGLRTVIERLHGRVNVLVDRLLFEAVVRQHLDRKEINARQYAIVRHVLEHGQPLLLATLRADPRYQAMYLKKTDKTRQRDMRGLLDKGLIRQDGKNQLQPGFPLPAALKV